MKILMVTMLMGIGGAETHILELSSMLHRMGHDVTVVSGGGKYAEELEKEGVKHITLTLNSKNPYMVLKARSALSSLIKKEKYDVVHAHSRIPAFICGTLTHLGFKYVTTAHWVFKVNFLWRRLSDWGQKTLAVSEDIKKYLIDNYGIWGDNIKVTINGLNTDKFSPDRECGYLRREFKMAADTVNILCVSRTDKSRGMIPLMLARLSPRIHEKYPNVRIIIVGGDTLMGEESVRPEIEEIARQGRETGDNSLIYAGPRTDIPAFCAFADIIVGASRSALEGMSAAKPLILAGNEGYIGRFTDKTEREAVATNFCCRGCVPPKEERLFDELCELIELSKEERRAEGERNRQFIIDNYGLERMAQDAIDLYNETKYISKKPDIVIGGYYGFENTGDESLLSAMLSELQRVASDKGVAVLCKNRRKMQRRYGVLCVNRYNIFALRRILKDASLLISGGGNLFQNSTSNKSLFYYLYVIKLAKKLSCRVMLWANGIGPIIGKWAEEGVKNAIASADHTSLREPASYEYAKRICPDNEKLYLTADPALLIAPVSREKAERILADLGIGKDKRLVFVSLRRTVEKDQDKQGRAAFMQDILSELKKVCEERELYPLFVPMQEKLDYDMSVYAQKTVGRGRVITGLTVSELCGVLSLCEVSIGMRLHSLIYSFSVGVPFVALSYDDKVSGFSKYAEMPYVIDMKESYKKGALTLALTGISSRRDEIVISMQKNAEKQRSLARLDAEAAKKLLQE